MFIKRLLALICAVMIFAGIPVVQADDTENAGFFDIPELLYYQGGVVFRGFAKGADKSAPPLNLAYVHTTMPYIVLNQPTNWEFSITGGSGEYTCQAILAYQDFSKHPQNDSWKTKHWFYVTGSSFEYTFTTPGRYFWEFRIRDSHGQLFSFQTHQYETYTETDEADNQTVAGKVNSIIEEVITPGMSSYSRARALHDWLIYNANYDYTYTYYEAAGVLLYGTGVCDSYARAYLMLCTAAGIECLYVRGNAGSSPDPASWGYHAWNMIKLDGNWYHVDCTWDDPGTGGSERHQYFCVNDETLAKDHLWNRPDDLSYYGSLPPASEGGTYENTANQIHYDFTFSTIEEYMSNIDRMVAEGKLYSAIYGKYTGDEDPSSFYQSTFKPRIQDKANQLYRTGFIQASSYYYGRTSSIYFYVKLPWKNPLSYVRINESTLKISIGEELQIKPQDYYPQSNAFTWTSSDPDIATVSATYDASQGLIATVKGLKDGTVTITAKAPSGQVDSLTVTVMPAYVPDFGFTLSASGSKVKLAWNAIPGITEYQIIRIADGHETVLAFTDNNSYSLTSAQLPDNVLQKVYIFALRKAGGEVKASYKSEAITYGTYNPTFTATLPAAVKAIDAQAFENCIFLTSFDIPSGVTAIGEQAFAGCSSLTTIRIPASVKSIGAEAFSNCPLRYAVVVEGSFAEQWLQEHFPQIMLIY